MSNNLAVHFKSDRTDWQTPQDFFDRLHAEFHFTIDVCATTAKREVFAFLFSRRRWSETGMDRGLLDEPALRTRDQKVDEESLGVLSERGHGGLPDAGQDGYAVVARLCGPRRDPLHPGTAEVRWTPPQWQFNLLFPAGKLHSYRFFDLG
jgi:hypothetical protein